MSGQENFWERNPKGIEVAALFGDKGGSGEIGQAIKKLDASGDGYLSKEEFRTGISEAIKTTADNKNLKRIAMVMGGLLVFTIFAIFGLTFAVFELSKETETGKDGVMHVPGTNTVVQTANSDTTVTSGNLKKPTMKSRNGNFTVEVAQATTEGALHSNLPDSFFEELRFFRVENGKSRIVIQVNGFVKVNAGETSRVIIITPIGDIAIEGTTLTFKDASTSKHFSEAGFATANRKLLSLYKLVGLFNNIDNFDGSIPADVAKPNFPEKFHATYDIYYKCINVSPDATADNENHLDRCAEARPNSATFTNIDVEGGNAKYLKTVSGELLYDNGKAVEIKKYLESGTQGYIAGKYYNGATKMTGQWFFDPKVAGDHGFSNSVPKLTKQEVMETTPAVAFCEEQTSAEIVDAGALIAQHFTGVLAGEKAIPAGVEGIGGETLMRWKLKGDAKAGHMDFIVHTDKATGHIQRITMHQNGETATYVFTKFDPNASFDISNKLKLPPGCSEEPSVNSPTQLDMVTTDSPLETSHANQKTTRLLLSIHSEEISEHTEYNSHAQRRRQLLQHPRRKLQSKASGIINVFKKVLSVAGSSNSIMMAYDEGGFPSYCKPDISSPNGGFVVAFAVGKKFGFAVGVTNFNGVLTPCSIAVNFNSGWPVPNIAELGGALSIFVDWSTLEFEVEGCIGFTLFGAWELVKICIFGGMCSKSNHVCGSYCDGDNQSKNSFYWGASGHINIVFVWMNFYYNQYPSGPIAKDTWNQFKWYVSCGINLGIFQIGGVVAGNSDSPYIWRSANNGNDVDVSKPHDASAGKRNLGSGCGSNGDCVTGQCCWCADQGRRWLCDTSSDWADDCDGEWAKKNGWCF